VSKLCFQGCIGAIDGTHIDAKVINGDEDTYRDRKHTTTQNVRCVADLDLNFTYVYAGWEGSAHDSPSLVCVLMIQSYASQHLKTVLYHELIPMSNVCYTIHVIVRYPHFPTNLHVVWVSFT
jgi:hypothetical protein